MPYDDPVIEADAHLGEQESVLALKAALLGRFIVREEHRDYGVDGTIEVTLPLVDAGRAVTNCRAYFQLKAVKSPHVVADGCLSYRLETKNLRYLSVQLPALYFVYDRERRLIHFRMTSDILNELDTDASRPGWRDYDKATVLFCRTLDDRAKDELQTLLLQHAENARALQDGPGFIRDYGKGDRRLLQLTVPRLLPVERETQVRLLGEMLTPGSLVWLTGPARAGKTFLVGSVLSDDAEFHRRRTLFPNSCALLYANVQDFIGRPVIRSVAAALGHKIDLSEDIESEDAPEDDGPLRDLVARVLPSRLQHRSGLLVLDNVHSALATDVSRHDLDVLVRCAAFRPGSVILLARHGPLPDGRPERRYKGEIALDELDGESAQQLLAMEGVPSTLVTSAFALGDLSSSVFLPGVLTESVDRFLAIPEAARTPARLVETIRSEALAVASDEVDQLVKDTADDDWRLGAFSLAIVGPRPWKADILDVAAVGPSMRDRLLNLRWLRLDESGYMLSSFARTVLRVSVATELRGPDGPAFWGRLQVRLERVLQELGKADGEQGEELHARSLEEAIAWLRREGLATGRGLERLLIRHLLPHVVDDLFYPFTEEEAHAFATSAEAVEGVATGDGAAELQESIAGLSMRTRLSVDRGKLHEKLSKAIELAAGKIAVSAVTWRVLDLAAFALAFHDGRIAEAMHLREKLLDRAIAIAGTEAAGPLLRKWAISWQINYAFAAIRSGSSDPAREILDRLHSQLAEMPMPDSLPERSELNVDRARVVILLAGTSRDHVERARLLREGVEMSLAAAADSAWRTPRVLYYLRCVRRLIAEVDDDDGRRDAIDRSQGCLRVGLGDEQSWPLEVRSVYAAVVRSAAGLVQRNELALALAGRAIAVLSGHTSDGELSDSVAMGDNRPILVLARCRAFRASVLRRSALSGEATAEVDRALKLVRIAVERAPTAEAWVLLLELSDQGRSEYEDDEKDPEMLTRRVRAISGELASALHESAAWLKSVQTRGSHEGALELYVRDRRWQREGSLVRRAQATSENDDWEKLSNASKQRTLTKVYFDRQRVLDSIERRNGGFADLFLSRIRLESQYQRLLAIYSDFNCNSQPVLDKIGQAVAQRPHDYQLCAAKARFYRYIWNYPQAVLSYRDLLQSGVGYQLRHALTAELIEVLLTSSTYNRDLIFPSGVRVSSDVLLGEAMQLLKTLPGTRQARRSQSILGDRIGYELGLPIDWAELERVYADVVGNDYLVNVQGHLDELRRRSDTEATNIATRVLQNFTSSRDLSEMGRLFLRRAEKGGGSESGWSRRAYVVFAGCAMLERSWTGQEQLRTAYLRARALAAGAVAKRSLNPFGLMPVAPYRNELQMASALMQRVVGQSVGLFRAEVRRALGALDRLRNELYPGV